MASRSKAGSTALNRWRAAPRQELSTSESKIPTCAYLRECASTSKRARVDYTDSDGVYFQGIEISVHSLFKKQGFQYLYFEGFSYHHGETKSFRIDRVHRFGAAAGVPAPAPAPMLPQQRFGHRSHAEPRPYAYTSPTTNKPASSTDNSAGQGCAWAAAIIGALIMISNCRLN